ncbi:rCG61696, partial [Rattus norvegicus]
MENPVENNYPTLRGQDAPA